MYYKIYKVKDEIKKARCCGRDLMAKALEIALEKMLDNGSDRAAFNNAVSDLTSGMDTGVVGEIIYDSDCRDLFLEHYDEIMEYIEELEEKTGEPVVNRKKLPLHTFYVWVFFEDIYYRLIEL